MVDQTNIDKAQTNIDKAQTKVEQAVEAVKAVKAPLEAAQAKIDIAAEKTVAKPVRKARASVAKRRARKAPAKVVVAVKKNNKRAAKAVKRGRKAVSAAAKTQIERNTNMTYDFTKMFAGFELPGNDRFQTLFADAGERSQDMVRKSQKTAEEMTDIAKANIEALTEAGRIAATGVRSIGQDALASGREGIEKASASLKTLAEAKSPTEFFQIQSELARASFDRAVAEGSKFAEAMVKLAGEAVQPLSNRATVNAERINELAA